MVSNLVTIATNYFGFYKLVSISWFSCSVKSLYCVVFLEYFKMFMYHCVLRNNNYQIMRNYCMQLLYVMIRNYT